MKSTVVSEISEKRKKGEPYTMDDFLTVIRILRGPGGCPWDMEQTHTSIRKNFIEETYEVLEAIDTENAPLLQEELGDVLIQVAMHAEMEAEKNVFSFADVVNGVTDKLVVRHPHIFGDVTADTTDQVLKNWDQIKREQKKQTHTQVLQSVPRYFPALMRADKLQKKAARAGFDWDSPDGALDKLAEESAELREAIGEKDEAHIREEMGDLLFAAVNAARLLGIDAEEALSEASEKFLRRFAGMEDKAIRSGRQLEEMTLAEMDKLWDEVKEDDRNRD